MALPVANDSEVVEAMEQYGGGFVKALAAALRRADDGNFLRIKDAFPDLWLHYANVHEIAARRKAATS